MLSSKGPGISYINVVLSNNKWIFCDNQEVSTGTWPKGAKSLYLAFYKHVSAHRTKSKLNMPHSVGTSDSKVSVKRKVAELANDDVKSSKKPCIRRGKGNDIKSTMSCDPEPSEHWGGITGFEAPIVRIVWPEYRYYPIDVEWQRQSCALLNVRFVHLFQRESGGSGQILTLPSTSTLQSIQGDGNCLFRAMSFIITGSQSQHFETRSAIMAHLISIPHLVTGIGLDGHQNYRTVQIFDGGKY